jgi:RNA polymerase sigma-32 factor
MSMNQTDTAEFEVTNVKSTQSRDQLAQFSAQARRFPMLKADEEVDLITRWRDEGDAKALEQLLGSHLRLVIKMAWNYSGYGLPVADLVSEGNIGLMQAAERFDTGRGFRFATYAQWWIRAAMQDYVMRTVSITRMGTTATQKKLFFNLRRLKNALDIYDDGDMTPEAVAEIARELDVPAEAVIDMNRRLTGSDASLNIALGADGDTTWQDQLRDDRPDQETEIARSEEFLKRWSLVEDAMAQLKPRERHIIAERKLSDTPKTLEQLSAVYGISRERVRQIEASAFKKLQQAVTDAAGLCGMMATDLLAENDNDAVAAA